MHRKIMIISDTIKDILITQSLEVFSFAKEIAGGEKNNILLVVPGRACTQLAREWADRLGINALSLENERLYYPNPELLWRCLQNVCRTYRPELICFQHTMRNAQAASALAVSLNACCITAVESFSVKESSLIFTRPAFNGKLNISVSSERPMTVVTLLPGAYPAPEEAFNESGKLVTAIRTDMNLPQCKVLDLVDMIQADVKLQEADVIIAAGRGVGSRENMEIIRETVGIFRNAAIGASRPICDLSWLPYAHQVGVTGKTVTPRLYMACGISGSQQHIAGMKNAKFIVAVNRDPHAAIFAISDVIINEDLTGFLRVFIDRFRERSAHKIK